MLKSVFVIGDSISCYYGRHLKKILKGMWKYDRKGGKYTFEDIDDGTNGENGGDSSMVLKYLRAIKDKGIYKPDYLLLNCGLHDIKQDAISKTYQVSPDNYEKNLREIYYLLQEMSIPLIWIRTTLVKEIPVKERKNVSDVAKIIRGNSNVILYNNIADKVMTEYGIPIIDLYTFTKNLGNDIYLDDVHFNEKGSGLQAAFIAGYLNAINQQADR